MAFQNLVAQKLAQAAIGTSISTIYITPANTQAYVKDIDICNTTSGAITVYVYLVASGATAGTTGSNANAIFYNTNIPAYSVVQWTGTQILNGGKLDANGISTGGDTIQVKASAAGLNITVSGAQAI
jgi:hypothetical protein